MAFTAFTNSLSTVFPFQNGFTINNGGGNLNFAQPIPEPETYARSVHERSREVARAIADTPQCKQSRRDCKKVEILFAHLKRILKVDRLRLRGLTGKHDEFLLAATAQNLRRMAKSLQEGQHNAIAMPSMRIDLSSASCSIA